MSLSLTIFIAGWLIGSILNGYLADNIGRRWTLLFVNLLSGTAGLVGAFLDDYVSYVISRLFVGIGKFKNYRVS